MMKINLITVRRLCKKCGELYRVTGTRGSKRNRCNACHAAYIREWNAKNPEKVKATNARRQARIEYRRQTSARSRMNFRATKYGVSYAMYCAMLEAQNGCCPICQKALPKDQNFCVDHDHDTLILRDLLCRKCNTILGFADDSIEVLQRAIEYLGKHREQPRAFKVNPPKDYRGIQTAKEGPREPWARSCRMAP